MAILPTAHASQRFGSRTIDFYVAPGQVIGSDPRSRADERRIQDLDGERHPVRVAKRDFALDPGDYAAVIRLQPGPKRRSRPVAVVNYRTNSWTRAHMDTPRLLSRAGVSRNANWMLSIVAFLAIAVLAVWPSLVAMLGIFAPGLAAGLPVFDIFALMAGLQPGLAEARLADMAPGLAEALGATLPQIAGNESAVIFALAVAGGLLVAFAARSWRFVWIPVFLAGLLAGAIAVAGPEAAMLPALLALGGSMLFFMVGGFINRWRDGARLEARVARLADHVLRHPPEEMVTRREQAPALSDDAGTDDAGNEEVSAEDGDTGDRGAQSVPASAASGAIAAAGAASIAARTTDGPDTPAQDGEDAASDQDEQAQADTDSQSDADATAVAAQTRGEDGSAEPVDTDAEPATQDSAPTAESSAAPEVPAQEDGDAQPDPAQPVPAEAVSDQAGRETPDPRREARSMDIPPPPPMPDTDAAQAADGDAETAAAPDSATSETVTAEAGDDVMPINRDTAADTSESDVEASAPQAEAVPAEPADDTGSDPDSEAANTASEPETSDTGSEDDEIASAPDAFGGGDDKRE